MYTRQPCVAFYSPRIDPWSQTGYGTVLGYAGPSGGHASSRLVFSVWHTQEAFVLSEELDFNLIHQNLVASNPLRHDITHRDFHTL